MGSEEDTNENNTNDDNLVDNYISISFLNPTQEEIETGMEIARMLASLNRTLRINTEFIGLYIDNLKQTKTSEIPSNEITLNQEQFGNFISLMLDSLRDTIIKINKPELIDFFLYSLIKEFHEFSLQFPVNNKYLFYSLMKIFLGKYPHFSKTQEESYQKYIELETNKFVFKDYTSLKTWAIYLHGFEHIYTDINIISQVRLVMGPEYIQTDSPIEILKKKLFKEFIFLQNYHSEFEIFLKRIENIGVIAWCVSSYLTRMYSNMVFAPFDDKVPSIDIIPAYDLHLALSSFEDTLKENYNFDSIVLSCIILSLLENFNQIHKGLAEDNEKKAIFYFISNNEEIKNWLIPLAEDYYQGACDALGKEEKKVNWLEKYWEFLKLFSLNPENIDITFDLLAQEKIPLVLEFFKGQYFVSSILFLSALDELIHRLGKHSGKFGNVKGKYFEQQVVSFLSEFTLYICDRIKFRDENIGMKTETDFDVVLLWDGILFLFECKAYSRINYQKKIEIREIEENIEEILSWKKDIDILALWVKDNLSKFIKKFNDKLRANKDFKSKKVVESDIKYIIPIVITIAPEFLLKIDEIGWLLEEKNIPRVCNNREIRDFFKVLISNKKVRKDLLSKDYVISNIE